MYAARAIGVGNFLESKIGCVIYANCVLNLLMVITVLCIAGTISPLVGEAGTLVVDSTKTLRDLNDIIPDVKSTLHMVKQICTYENFTKHYGFLCN